MAGRVGRGDLGGIAAHAQPGNAVPGVDAQIVEVVDFGDQFCAGVRARVGGKEAGLVGEDEQEVGADQGGDEGGEVVVVADFDLFGGDGVVLVDDEDDAIIEQRGEGVAR